MGRGGSTIESALRPWEDSACASRDGSCAKLGFDVKSKFAILFDDVTNCLNVWLNSGKAPLEHLLLMPHGSLKTFELWVIPQQTMNRAILNSWEQ